MARFYSVYLEYPRATAPAQPLHSERFASKAKAARCARAALAGGGYGFATVNAFTPAGFLGTVNTIFPRRAPARSNCDLFLDSLRLAVSAPPNRLRDAVKLAEHFARRLTPAEIKQARAQIAGEVAAGIKKVSTLMRAAK